MGGCEDDFDNFDERGGGFKFIFIYKKPFFTRVFMPNHRLLQGHHLSCERDLGGLQDLRLLRGGLVQGLELSC